MRKIYDDIDLRHTERESLKAGFIWGLTLGWSSALGLWYYLIH